jgi:hypothetical protein
MLKGVLRHIYINAEGCFETVINILYPALSTKHYSKAVPLHALVALGGEDV